MRPVRGWPWLAPAPAQAGLEELIATAKPSVVAVGVFNPTSSPRFGFRGSGFVVGAGNVVVTNAHVLPDVIPPGGSEGSLAVVVPTQGASEAAALRGATLLGSIARTIWHCCASMVRRCRRWRWPRPPARARVPPSRSSAFRSAGRWASRR